MYIFLIYNILYFIISNGNRIFFRISIVIFIKIYKPSSIVYAGAFNLYDLDNDGYVTKEEMINIVEAIYEMVGADVQVFIETTNSQERCL